MRTVLLRRSCERAVRRQMAETGQSSRKTSQVQGLLQVRRMQTKPLPLELEQARLRPQTRIQKMTKAAAWTIRNFSRKKSMKYL